MDLNSHTDNNNKNCTLAHNLKIHSVFRPKSDKNIVIETEFDKLKLRNLPKKNELSQVIGNNQISNINHDNTLRSDSIKLNLDNSKINNNLRLDNYIINNNKFKFDIMKKLEEKNNYNNNKNNNINIKKESNNSNKPSDSNISERLAKINSKIQKYVNN